MSDFKVIGKRTRKIGTRARMTGEAKYADDLSFPNQLDAVIVRTPHAHANIVEIDVTDALAIEGVVAIITGHDLFRTFGILGWTRDEPPLAVEKVTYQGEGVAAVCAEDLRTAEKAARLVKVEYDLLPPVLDAATACDEGTPIVRPGNRKGNLTKNVKLSFGEVQKGLDESDAVVAGKFYFENTNHVAIEPHAIIAYHDPEGLLTVWSSTQTPHYLQREMADVLLIPQSRIRIIVPAIGGGFGGKSEPVPHEFVAAKLSMITGPSREDQPDPGGGVLHPPGAATPSTWTSRWAA